MTSAGTSRPGRRAPYDPRKIKRKRDEQGLTQNDLSERSGLSTTHISRLELGRGGVSATALAQLADALGCAAADLMPDEPAAEASADVAVQRLRSDERAVPHEVLEVRR